MMPLMESEKAIINQRVAKLLHKSDMPMRQLCQWTSEIEWRSL